MMTTLGIQDVPITEFSQDALGIKGYAEALTKFVLKCKTPMTIAIQGDWGSGKTSLMQLIKKSLDDQVIPIEFNTWQFSQFNMAADLPVLMMEHFTEEVEKGLDPDVKESVEKGVKEVYRFFRRAGSVVTSAALKKMGADTSAKDVQDLFTTPPLKELKAVKNDLRKIVAKRCDKEGGKRIVVFIDDLDRLVPVKALELLEVMKVFLDLEGCVFLLACDFEIVRKGISEKFRIPASDFSGKSFFDKIFQLSFHMPTARYKIDEYLGVLMSEVGFGCNKNDLGTYTKLLRYSIGFNARNIKRLINSLVLLNIVQNNPGQNLQASDHRQRVLFAVGCMEMAFTPLYNYIMSRLQEDRSNLGRLFEKEFQSPDTIAKLPELRQLFAETSEKERMADRISEFMGAFVKSLQIDEDSILSEIEINNLEQVMALTSLTSSTGRETEAASDTWQDEISVFCRRVRDKLYHFGLGPERYSKKAIGNKNWRLYGVWYNRRGWQQWGLSYHLIWFPGEKEFKISLAGNWSNVSRLGWEKSQLMSKLANLDVLKAQGFCFRDWEKDPDRFDFWTGLEPPDWNSEDDVTRVAKVLETLIRETRHLFDAK
jgi:KAP family P-loop domain